MRLADLSWRHHELGMLQAEFDEEHRIHLWDRRLVGNWTDNPCRAIHDHRFDLASHVIHGEIEDVSYEVWPFDRHRGMPGLGEDGDEDWDEYLQATHARRQTRMWEILNAKRQLEARRVMEGTTVVARLCDVLVRETGRRTFRSGAHYWIPRRAFHTTVVEDFAITLVTRSNFDDRPARILGDEADSAIRLDTDFGPTLERAQEVLDRDCIVEALVETHHA